MVLQLFCFFRSSILKIIFYLLYYRNHQKYSTVKLLTLEYHPNNRFWTCSLTYPDQLHYYTA